MILPNLEKIEAIRSVCLYSINFAPHYRGLIKNIKHTGYISGFSEKYNSKHKIHFEIIISPDQTLTISLRGCLYKIGPVVVSNTYQMFHHSIAPGTSFPKLEIVITAHKIFKISHKNLITLLYTQQ